MPTLLRLPRLVALLGAVALAPIASAQQPGAAAASAPPAQLVVHMLDYVGVDYPEAVEHGKIRNEDEFKEMVEFTAQVSELLKALPPHPRKAQLLAEAVRLQALVAAKATAETIAEASGRLRWAVIEAYDVAIAPRRPPDLRAAAGLYREHCAACHGPQGRGGGAAAKNMDPPPTDFHDASRMAARSAYSLYNAITLGVAGTAMLAFKQLADDERWALAFLVAGFADVESARRGESLWASRRDEQALRDLATAATLSPNEVKAKFGADAVAVQAYLLAHPERAGGRAAGPIAFSLQTLGEALSAYSAGNRARAQQLAVTAYLEGFELVEAALANVDATLMTQAEREMMAFRALLSRGAPLEQVERQHATVAALLTEADARLAGARLTPAAAFASALVILLREGMEAILVLAAIIAFLVKTGRRDALPYIHVGWALAVVLGMATWFVAATLIRISGATREVTEGITALVAVAILLYVGFWLHGEAHAQRWQQFIRQQVTEALGRRTLWAMALVSFLAVYREMFEMVLFYEALWAQVGPESRSALFAGIGTAAVLLLAAGWAVFRYSIRLPIQPFFSATSILLALLAVVFTGQGVAALQEAGQVPVSAVDFVRLPALGIFPTWQTLGAQLAVAVLVVTSFRLASRGAQRGERMAPP